MRYVIIQGSARSNGNTHQIARIFIDRLSAHFIDLKDKRIHDYSYAHDHLNDDFIDVVREILKYDTLVFITPVYWYAMSGIMKTFFDRMTDCLKAEKTLGRRLKGKNMIAISCGSDEEEVLGFFEPFKRSAGYLEMNYMGNLHTWIENEFPSITVLNNIDHFVKQL